MPVSTQGLQNMYSANHSHVPLVLSQPAGSIIVNRYSNIRLAKQRALLLVFDLCGVCRVHDDYRFVNSPLKRFIFYLLGGSLHPVMLPKEYSSAIPSKHYW